MAETTVSERSRLVSMILAIFGGFAGLHRFYVGKVGSGIGMLCTLGGLGLWWLADCVIIAAGDFRDGDGRRIVRWTADEELPQLSRPNDALVESVEDMRAELSELHERMDFMERMLTQVKERSVPPARGT